MISRAQMIALVTTLALAGIVEGSENPNPPVDPLPITLHDRKDHPFVYVTRADFEQARKRAEMYPWAKRVAGQIIKDADGWLAKDEATLLKLIPPPGATYAYGLTGCPICQGQFADWWGGKGAATLDDPDHVKCVNGHRLPDDAHPDTGDGYVDPATGKRYYLLATFRSFAIDSLMGALSQLSSAYGYTDDARYAERAAFILDRLAAIYPTDVRGSVDYPSPQIAGRFNRPWYQVARRLVMFVNVYDILRMGDVLDKPSVVSGKTRRENIEQNMLLDGALFCYKQSADTPMLHNGEADYQRGQMAVAAVLGIPEYMKWAVDGPFGFRNMLENNIDRDGQYYETSSGYSIHARMLYLDMADILKNYRDAEHPDGYDVIRSPKFRRMLTRSRARLDAGGLLASLGDDQPLVGRLTDGERDKSFDIQRFETERLAALTDDAGLATSLEEQVDDVEAYRARTAYKSWLLFHALDVPAPTSANPRPPESQPSDLLHQRGLAFLRDGASDKSRAITLRAGPTLNHGHFDEMGLNVYAEGYQLSYDIGYRLGSTHAYRGLGRHTASHNLVLVNETSQLKAGKAGGSVEQFAALPGISYVRANDPACYASENVSTYARDVMFVNIDQQTSYGFDIFRVIGGNKHDYLFHGIGTEVTTEGLSLSAPAEGSIAGKDIHWGELIGSDGDISTAPNRPYWDPSPGNGLGFMMRPRTATPTGISAVTWNVADDAHLRLNLLPTPSTNVVLADAPGLAADGKHPSATYLFARRAGDNLKSTFGSIIEPFGKDRAVKDVRALPVDGDGVGASVALSEGRRDVVLRAFTPTTFRDGEQAITLDAGSARIRFAGDAIERVDLFAGSELSVGSTMFKSTAPAYRGTVESIDGTTLRVKGDLPTGDLAKGQTLTVGRATYSQRSTYTIASIERKGDSFEVVLEATTLALGRGHLQVAPPDGHTLPNIVPIEYAKSLPRVPSGYLDGKRVRTADSRAATTIRAIADPLACVMTVDSSAGFKAGDDLIVEDIQPGDDIALPATISVRRSANGWEQLGNTPAKITQAN